MPLVDLPLERLQTYQGRNPRPADFDAYWQRALSALDATDPKAEWSEYALGVPKVRAQELQFRGVGDAKIYAKCLWPETTDPVPVILLFHGYAWKSPDWFSLLAWTAAGFGVIAMDVRGQGGRSEDPGGHAGNTLRGHIVRGLGGHPDGLFFRQVYLDTAQLARIALGDPRVASVHAHGASQGGALTLACAALEPRVKTIAPMYPFLCDFQRVWEMDLAKDAYEELRLYFRIQDPLHETEAAVFEKLGYIDIQHLAPRIQAETYFITGLMDTICPPSTQFAAYNKIVAPKQMLIFPDFGHEGLPSAADHVLRFFTAQCV